MVLPQLHNVSFSGQVVGIRVGYDVPLSGGVVQDVTRIEESLPTINYVLEHGGTPILLTHLGRPKGIVVKELSLKPLLPLLESLLSRKVFFAESCTHEDIDAAVGGARKDGGVVLLENLRFYGGEESNSKAFSASLAEKLDAYINDAFSVAHRAHASTVGIPALMEGRRYAGFHFVSEMDVLSGLMERIVHPFVVILGGAKANTKLPLIEAFHGKADTFLIGGALANTFLAAEGYEVGTSRYESDMTDVAQDMLLRLEQYKERVYLPEDVVACEQFGESAEVAHVGVEDMLPHLKIGDIGPKTTNAFIEILTGANTVIWNGPLGMTEYSPFQESTSRIARILTHLSKRGTVIVGGGDTLFALKTCGVDPQEFSHVSTSGGAFLEFIEKGALPASDILLGK